ncbi:hypothetical protein PgNI_05653 [Pyricularia grisea]|uniref:Nitrogen regulatory protein areA GATA-like domain-containing protein n=1 Tax=Pyricularia grisea TaxID=148305 RepID=A0A6P8B485_PYRGI|nr:hypothetical protein PgNI_05653 [Pyricularia grisea]TLD10141.1 hypothetical protein PgNI_05653 [Pyricularia grisea]
MPCMLQDVLKVDPEAIHGLDTGDVENLVKFWTVFTRCGDSVAKGRRLENIAWRVWNHQTFCAGAEATTASFPTGSLPREIERKIQQSSEDMPQLSASVDSIADEEAVDCTAASPTDSDRPRICRQDSCSSSRSRCNISSDEFEKMVTSIIQTKDDLTLPSPLPSPVMSSSKPVEKQVEEASTEKPRPATLAIGRTGSTSDSDAYRASPTQSVGSSQQSSPVTRDSPPSHPVIRGFSTSHIPMFHNVTSQPRPAPIDTIPEPTSSPQAKLVQSKKPQAKFALGGSSSCDDSHSERGHSPDLPRQPVPQIKRKMFQVGGSSEEGESLKSAMHSARSGLLSPQKKQASFSRQVVTRTFPPVMMDHEYSDVDESAIDDDDDDSEWEDSNEESGKSSMDDKTLFKRVDSKVNLTSRRSLITLMLERNDRQSKLGNGASQSASAIHQGRMPRQGPSFVASPNDSDDSPLMMKRGSRAAQLKPINEIPRSAAQPIVAPIHVNNQQAALSPRTTRRNMLSTELTESLRRDLVWERSQKSSTVNAVLKRRHTSHNVANLKQYPERAVVKKENDGNASSWDQYFAREAFGGYHVKGW